VVAALALAMTGCSADRPPAAHIGVWGMVDDVSVLENDLLTRAPQSPDERREKLRALIARARVELKAGLTTVEFTRDRVVVGFRQLPYELRSAVGDEIVLDVNDGGQRKELRLSMRGPNTIVTDMAIAGGKPLTLRRMY